MHLKLTIAKKCLIVPELVGMVEKNNGDLPCPLPLTAHITSIPLLSCELSVLVEQKPNRKILEQIELE